MSKITNKDFQLFRLSPEIWKYTNLDDINQTFKDMMELDLDCAPYSNFAIEIKVIFINGLYHMNYVSEKEKNWTMLIEYEMEKFKVEDKFLDACLNPVVLVTIVLLPFVSSFIAG